MPHFISGDDASLASAIFPDMKDELEHDGESLRASVNVGNKKSESTDCILAASRRRELAKAPRSASPMTSAISKASQVVTAPGASAGSVRTGEDAGSAEVEEGAAMDTVSVMAVGMTAGEGTGVASAVGSSNKTSEPATTLA